MKAGLLVICVASAALSLAACSASSGGEAATPSAESSLDCAGARLAMEDYGTALVDMATGLEAQDPMSAVAGADALMYAVDQLLAAVPDAPEPAQVFGLKSKEVATQIKAGLADGKEISVIVEEASTAFGDAAFEVGGDAIDDYVDEACPETAQSGSAQ